jgi:hypothetical protein
MKAPKRARATPPSRRAAVTGLAPSSRELMLRLDHLRSSAREVARAYLANLEHDIIQIREAVGGVKDGGGRQSKLRRDVIDRMSDLVDDVALKPHKGRRGDLKKVEKIIRELQRLVAKHVMTEPRSSG